MNTKKKVEKESDLIVRHSIPRGCEKRKRQRGKNLSVNIPHLDKPQRLDQQGNECQSARYTCRYTMIKCCLRPLRAADTPRQ